MSTRTISVPVWYLPDGATVTIASISFTLVDADRNPIYAAADGGAVVSRLNIETGAAPVTATLTATDSTSPGSYYLVEVSAAELHEVFLAEIPTGSDTLAWSDLKTSTAATIPTLYDGDDGDIITVTFTDLDGDAVVPTTIHYSIYDITNDQEVRAEEAITPAASSVDITLEASDTTMIDPVTNALELRKIIVIINKGSSGQRTGLYHYYLQEA